MYKVSIIIPVYNAEKYIERCLESILNSGVTDYEIICIDDGSTDDSLQLLREYEKKYEQILVLTQKNSHAGIARNHGMQYARGEFIHFMDADDEVVPGAYSRIIQTAEALGADYLKIKAMAVDSETGERIPNAYYELTNIPEESCNCILPEEKATELLLKTARGPWTAIVRRSYIEEQNLKFNGLRCANDRSFFVAVLANTKRLAVCKELLVRYYANNKESLTGIRHKNFECHYESYKIISEMVKTMDKEKRDAILLAELVDMWHWYCLLDKEGKEEHCAKVEEYLGLVPELLETTEDVLRLTEEKKSVYIYGAGKVANALVEWMRKQNVLHCVNGILVSKREGNPDSICGVPVFAVEEVALDVNSVVLIAMYENTQVQVLGELKKRNLQNVYVPKNGVCGELINSL